MNSEKPRVGLFVTCLVDLMRPSVGFAAMQLLEQAGCEVEVPVLQTCCGQPAYNSGDRKGASDIARQVIEVFDAFDYVVAPSGSCAGMLKEHYPALFADDPVFRDKAQAFADKCFELISFLVDIREMEQVEAAYEGSVTYHDSCAGLRELGIKAQPRKLLESVDGLTLREMEEAETCCGFGGTFCVKYSDVSGAITGRKADLAEASGADLLLAGDLGCLLNMAGKLSREGATIRARHVAEVLAGLHDTPPIGARR